MTRRAFVTNLVAVPLLLLSGLRKKSSAHRSYVCAGENYCSPLRDTRRYALVHKRRRDPRYHQVADIRKGDRFVLYEADGKPVNGDRSFLAEADAYRADAHGHAALDGKHWAVLGTAIG
jgi:hypothetical protein